MKTLTSPCAPRLFWTRRGAERWLSEHNPHPTDTADYFDWRSRFWGNQSDRMGKQSFVWSVVSIVFLCISIAAMLVGALT